MRRLRATALLAGIIAVSTSAAATIEVKQDGTGDYTTIQAAIDAAESGDEILVYPGTYPEHLTVQAGDFDVRSVAGPYLTLVSGITADTPLLHFTRTLPTTTLVEGFTFQGAFGGTKADGIFIERADVTLRRCIIRDNDDEGLKVGTDGSGVGVTTLIDCLVVDNGFGTFPSGWGVAIQDSGVVGFVDNCTIARNGQGLLADYGADVTVSGSIVSDQLEYGVYVAHGATMTTECSDVSLNPVDRIGVPPGVGDFSLDPQFCADLDEYYLGADSPCLPGAHPDGIDCGLIGARPECTVVSVPGIEVGGTVLITAARSPVRRRMTFALLPLAAPSELRIFDVTGRSIHTARIAVRETEYRWEFGAYTRFLPAGVYFARRTLADGTAQAARVVVAN